MVVTTGGTQAGSSNQQQESGQGPQELHYLPGEVCLTCVSSGANAVTPDALLGELLGRLNAELPRLIASHDPDVGGDFRDDLDVPLLRSFFADGRGLQPLDLLRGVAPEPPPGFKPSPVVQLPARRGRRDVALLFYQFQDAFQDFFHDGAAAARVEIVRQFVNFVNLNLNQVNELSRTFGWAIIAATPNWLHAPAQNDGVTGGGPGARPEPAASGKHFAFTDVELNAALQKDKKGRVVVAVLDTSPCKATVDGAAKRFQEDNDLLASVAAHLDVDGRIDGDLSLPEDYFNTARLQEITSNWRKLHPNDPLNLFEMPDHGLFVAGIIYDIISRAGNVEQLPPNFEIHLIRVLSRYGVGDLWALTSRLSALPDKFLLQDGQLNDARLVVNLSLMADLPPGVSLEGDDSTDPDHLRPKPFLDFWLPNTARARGQAELAKLLQNPRNGRVAAAIKLTHRSLQETVDWLCEALGGGGGEDDQRKRVLVIAAAGNDAEAGKGESDRPLPRLPARYDNILGVAAVNRDLGSAQYSNLGDDVSIVRNGIAVFGGDAIPGHPGRIDMHPAGDAVDAIVGIFSAETLPAAGVSTEPPEDRNNQTGWVYWSGTSFATPVISGVAACLWSANSSVEAQHVMNNEILNPDFDTGPKRLQCPVIDAKQV